MNILSIINIMNIEKIKHCGAVGSLKCERFVFMASFVFGKLLKRVEREQLLNLGLMGLVYTNNFNIVVDGVFRLALAFERFIKEARTKYGVCEFVMIDDISEGVTCVSDIECVKSMGYDARNELDYNEGKKLIKLFKELVPYVDPYDIADFTNWERYLGERFPDVYNFTIFDLRRGDEYERNEFKYVYRAHKFLKELAKLQCHLNNVERLEVCRYVLRCVRKSKFPGLRIVVTKSNFVLTDVLRLYGNEWALFGLPVYSDNIGKRAYWYDLGRVVVPSIRKSLVLPPMTGDVLFDSYPSRRRVKIPSLIDLFDLAQESCGGKIIDYNPDYRYVYFDNLKEFYKHGRIGVIMPTEWECVQYNWVNKNEYADMLCNWVYQFNKFCKVKLV